jgi:dolichyl-phosphate-mannose--protein O-mannosyl transferase
MATDTDTEPEDLPALGSRVRRRARRAAWYARPFVVIAAVTAVAAGLRLYHLSAPHSFVFDEVYYAKDACLDAGFPYRRCQLDSPNEQTATVHPPLGRWIIAGGVAATGKPSDFGCQFGAASPRCHPFSFRVASAVFGTLSVLLLAILAYRLFGSALWAGAAGLLLATENLNFVQSRVSMLDIFLVAFVVAGFLSLVLDRQWMQRRTPVPSDLPEESHEAYLLALPPDRPPAPIFRPWRLAAGVAFGAAVATKWSGVPALAAAILLTLAWERTRRSQIGLPHALREALRDEAFGIFLFLLVVPVAVYVASYTKWFADHHGLNLVDWWHLQRDMANYSIHLRAKHPYSSPAWSWLLLKRPVAYYYQCFGNAANGCVHGRPAEILGVGNPAIFWGSLLAMPYALFSWIRKRDWRAGLILLPFVGQYGPWFFAARTNFLFYLAPVTPFMVLAGTYALKDLFEVELGPRRVRAFAPVAGLLLVVSVGLFVFFLPVLTARAITYQAWKVRMWFPSWI